MSLCIEKLHLLKKYLNITGYTYVDPFIEEDLINSDYPYLWVTASKLAINYKIETINGTILHPIITLDNIKLRMITNKLNFYVYMQNKYFSRLLKRRNMLLDIMDLPLDLIDIILSYFDFFLLPENKSNKGLPVII